MIPALPTIQHEFHTTQNTVTWVVTAYLLSASIWVSDAGALYAEFESRGAPFHQTLKREAWHSQGHGGFIVRDPDGNLLGFGGRID